MLLRASLATLALLAALAPARAQLPPSATLIVNQTPVQGGSNGQCLFINSATVGAQACGGAGTVTSVSVTTANGVSGSVATPTTTPAITLTLGAITPSSVTTPSVVGGSGTTQSLTFQTTSGIGAAGADAIFLVGNNGATQAVRIYNSGAVSLGGSSDAGRVGQVTVIGLNPGVTVQGTTNGTTNNAATQTINSTAGVNATMIANEPGRTTSRWGFAIGNWAEYVDFGTNGVVFGEVSNAPVVFGTNALERARISAAGGFSVGTTADPGIGKISALNGFVANGSSGVTRTCTIAVGNVLTFTLGILTATSGVAGCV